MGTIRRKNEAVKAMNAAEQAMPGAYQSKYKDRINAALDALGGSGTDSAVDDLTAQAFDQYRQRAGQNASAAAQNAVDVTNGLSGGYGSSWAGNVAQQGYNEQMAAVDDALSSLRAKAASRVQDQQNSLTDLLNAMMTQENMDQSEHSGSVADAQSWRDYTASRADTARQEVSNFWNNAWNTVKNAGSAALTAYDTYKGYTQQQWANQMAEKQYNDSYEKDILDRAYEYYKNKDEPELANKLLSEIGLTTDVFNQKESGEDYTFTEQLKGLKDAISLAQAGQTDAARWVAQSYGLPENLINYSLYTATGGYSGGSSGGGSSYSRSSGSTGSSGSSGSSGGTSGGIQYSSGNITTLLGKLASLKEGTTQYKVIADQLRDAGVNVPGSTDTSGTQPDRRIQLNLAPLSSKWGSIGTTGGSKTTQSGQTSSTGSGMSYQDALSRAQKWKADGVDEDTIYARLVNQGVTDAVAAKVWNAMGW